VDVGGELKQKMEEWKGPNKYTSGLRHLLQRHFKKVTAGEWFAVGSVLVPLPMADSCERTWGRGTRMPHPKWETVYWQEERSCSPELQTENSHAPPLMPDPPAHAPTGPSASGSAQRNGSDAPGGVGASAVQPPPPAAPPPSDKEGKQHNSPVVITLSVDHVATSSEGFVGGQGSAVSPGPAAALGGHGAATRTSEVDQEGRAAASTDVSKQDACTASEGPQSEGGGSDSGVEATLGRKRSHEAMLADDSSRH
jgi:hypothetical protein